MQLGGNGPGGTTLIDARNGFNKLSRYAMLWTVQHLWPAGARFVFNCYRHWALLIIRRPDSPPIIIHSKEGVTQGDPLAMIIYGITLVPLSNLVQETDRQVLPPFYTDGIALDGAARRNACLLKVLVAWGPDRGYYPEPEKSIHVCNFPWDVEAARAAFEAEGIM
eukprot:2184347-Ditylum_brightwellii.AAC.1